MPSRSANFAAALFASILAGANVTAVTELRAQAAADNCLTAPKGTTPAGSHWHYRLERGTKRQCWYLKDENDKSARAAPQEPRDSSPAAEAASAAADPVPPPPRPAVRKSVANARAELTSPRARTEPDSSTSVQPQTTDAALGATMANSPVAAAPDAGTPSSTVATRWPDVSGINPSGNIRTAAADIPARQPEYADTASQPATTPVALAAADSSMAKQTASMQMLFLVMVGALAMAGITASLVFRFGHARARQPAVRADRRAMWDSIDRERMPPGERPSPSMPPAEDIPVWRNRAEYDDPRAPDDPQRRLTEMLSRLARSAQN